ncbi:MAG: hypothetical protein V1656_03420 [Candidatus Jorgensenbacteria bacterium]
MTKSESLLALEREIERDESLPLRESNLVFGEGSPDAIARNHGRYHAAPLEVESGDM